MINFCVHHAGFGIDVDIDRCRLLYYKGRFIAPGQPFLIVCDQGRSNFVYYYVFC